VRFVLLLISRVDEYVIELTHCKVIDIKPQTMVHGSLERGRPIREAKSHNSLFELTTPGSECSLVLITFFDQNQLAGVPQIQFGNDTSFSQSVEHLQD
jgi:hypothetical protein